MWTVHKGLWPMGLICQLIWCRSTNMVGYPTASRPWPCTHRTSLFLQVSSWYILSTLSLSSVAVWHTALALIKSGGIVETTISLIPFGIVVYIICFSTGGPGLEPPYRPARNPQMNKMMTTRPSYPGMMPGMQGNMPGMMGLDKQYPIGYKPQSTMPQGQMLRQQLQVRLVS